MPNTFFDAMPWAQGVAPAGDRMRQLVDMDAVMNRQHQEKLAGVQADAAKFGAQQQQNRFNTVWPFLQSQFQGMQQGGAFTAGGQSGQGPRIDAKPVYDTQQIQGQVNDMRARGDQQVQSQQRQLESGMAGRGFGGNSPLAQALGSQMQAQNYASQIGQERDLRFQAAGANANQVLKGQQAQEQQFASRQQEDIERRKPYLQSFNTLLGALAGLV